ncbi:hypothetical protein GCM10020219_054490 [Nonomuraea dietziae]
MREIHTLSDLYGEYNGTFGIILWTTDKGFVVIKYMAYNVILLRTLPSIQTN